MALAEKPRIINLGSVTLVEIKEEVAKGAKFVVFAYTIAFGFHFIKRGHSPVFFLKPKDWRIKYSYPYLLISLLLGWWGVIGWPYIFMDFYEAFVGKDFTKEVLYAIENNTPLVIKLAT